MEPAFLPPRPYQVEGPRGRRSPAAPTHRLSARLYQAAAPQSSSTQLAGAHEHPACPLSLSPGSLISRTLYANPTYLPHGFWTLIAEAFRTNQPLTEVPHPIPILPLVVTPEPTQPREGVAGSSSWLDLGGTHSSTCLPARYSQGQTSFTLAAIPEVAYSPPHTHTTQGSTQEKG